jgi:hypothetical protein
MTTLNGLVVIVFDFPAIPHLFHLSSEQTILIRQFENRHRFDRSGEGDLLGHS